MQDLSSLYFFSLYSTLDPSEVSRTANTRNAEPLPPHVAELQNCLQLALLSFVPTSSVRICSLENRLTQTSSSQTLHASRLSLHGSSHKYRLSLLAPKVFERLTLGRMRRGSYSPKRNSERLLEILFLERLQEPFSEPLLPLKPTANQTLYTLTRN